MIIIFKTATKSARITYFEHQLILLGIIARSRASVLLGALRALIKLTKMLIYLLAALIQAQALIILFAPLQNTKFLLVVY